jgi:ABC-type spermidine/putrescine transport system permease subunit I
MRDFLIVIGLIVLSFLPMVVFAYLGKYGKAAELTVYAPGCIVVTKCLKWIDRRYFEPIFGKGKTGWATAAVNGLIHTLCLPVVVIWLSRNSAVSIKLMCVVLSLFPFAYYVVKDKKSREARLIKTLSPLAAQQVVIVKKKSIWTRFEDWFHGTFSCFLR